MNIRQFCCNAAKLAAVRLVFGKMISGLRDRYTSPEIGIMYISGGGDGC
jgi:hypothetical protein